MAWELLQILSILNQILSLFVDNDKVDVNMLEEYINQLEARIKRSRGKIERITYESQSRLRCHVISRFTGQTQPLTKCRNYSRGFRISQRRNSVVTQ